MRKSKKVKIKKLLKKNVRDLAKLHGAIAFSNYNGSQSFLVQIL